MVFAAQGSSIVQNQILFFIAEHCSAIKNIFMAPAKGLAGWPKNSLRYARLFLFATIAPLPVNGHATFGTNQA